MQYVYLLHAQMTQSYKIGMTTRPVEQRAKEINGRQSPFPIVLVTSVAVPDARKLEKELHQKFAKYRKHGEWFTFSSRQVTEVIRAMESDASEKFNPLIIIVGFFIWIQLVAFLGQCQQRPQVKESQQYQHRSDISYTELRYGVGFMQSC